MAAPSRLAVVLALCALAALAVPGAGTNPCQNVGSAPVPTLCPPLEGKPDAILATPGWFPGVFLDLPADGGTSVAAVVQEVYASDCCEQALAQWQQGVRWVSFQARTNSGSKGTCFMFVEEQCSASLYSGLPNFDPNGDTPFSSEKHTVKGYPTFSAYMGYPNFV